MVNDVEARLALTEATVADYVRFFPHFLRAQEGAFVLSESSEEIGWSKNPYLQAGNAAADAVIKRF